MSELPYERVAKLAAERGPLPLAPKNRRPWVQVVIEQFNALGPGQWHHSVTGATVGVIATYLREEGSDFKIEYIFGYGWRIRRVVR